MGTDSFGKGSVQTVMPLNEDYGLKLTTARYFTPAGRSIQALGIVPDIVVKRAKLTELSSQPFFKEADLAGHLSNGDEKKTKSEDSDKPIGTEPDDAIDRDFQMREAVSLIKGVSIFHSKQPSAAEQ
jgi:carboxyl-terminal processing protease